MEFPRYESYRDSGVDWLGEIPTDWNLQRLGAAFEERKEKVSDKDFPPLSVTKNGILPQLDSAAKSDDGDNRKGVREGDFVINSRSDRKGSSGIAKKDGSVSLINIVLKPKAISPRYCEHLLKSNGFIEEFYRNGHGIVADLWTTRYWDMKSINIPLPDMATQERIANFLDQKTAEIDEAIAKKQRLIELLKEQKAILINQAVTKGLNSDVPMRDSGVEWIGEVPRHWTVRRLKYYSEVQGGITLGKLFIGNKLISVPYLRVANVQDGYYKLDEIAELQLPQKVIDQYLVRVGDILVTEGGDIDKLGRGTVWEGEIKICIHQNHIFAVRVKKTAASEYFVSLAMGADYGRKYFTQTANKTTNLASTNRTKLGNFPIALPPLTEQKLIIAYANDINSRYSAVIETVQKEISALLELKQIVVADAVTGKIKIPEPPLTPTLSH